MSHRTNGRRRRRYVALADKSVAPSLSYGRRRRTIGNASGSKLIPLDAGQTSGSRISGLSFLIDVSIDLALCGLDLDQFSRVSFVPMTLLGLLGFTR